MENKEFEIDGRLVNVLIDYDKNEVWLSQKEMSVLYCKSIKETNRYINGLSISKKEAVITKNEITEIIFAITGSDGKTYNVKHYNLDIILKVGYKCNYDITVRFKEWVDDLFNDNYNLVNQNKWLNGANNYEIVKFESGNLSLDINVSPSEDTVWLSVIDMSLLFDRDRSVITKHIQNVFKEKEVDEKRNVQKMHIANSDKMVDFYSLNVVISVGYRVKSKRGTEFRIWANSILKHYLIKGYAINNKRCLEHSDILISLSNDMNLVKDEINNIKTQVSNNTSLIAKINASEVLIDGKLVYEGNIYSAYSFIRDLFIKAKNKLIIIDGYVDKSVLDMLDDINVEILYIHIQVLI